MSSKDFLNDETDAIAASAASPDGDTSRLESVAESIRNDKPKKSRGRPRKEDKEEVKQKEALYETSAKALNTAVFISAQWITGTDAVIPEKKQQDVMDSALSAYMASKDFQVSPEVALFSVYASWLGTALQKKEVKQSMAQKWKSKFSKWFKSKKEVTSNESDDR